MKNISKLNVVMLLVIINLCNLNLAMHNLENLVPEITRFEILSSLVNTTIRDSVRKYNNENIEIINEVLQELANLLKTNKYLNKLIKTYVRYDFNKQLLNHGINIDINKNDLLIEAIKRGYLDVVKVLVKIYNADINAHDINGNTPLMLAVNFGAPHKIARNKDNIYILDQIVAINTNKYVAVDPFTRFIANSHNLPKFITSTINSKDCEEETCPHSVVLANANLNMELDQLQPRFITNSDTYFNIIKILLKNRANTNIQNNNGDTALMIAVNNMIPSIVTDLIMHGANVDIKNRNGDTALIQAVRNNNTGYVEILLRDKLVNVNNVINEQNNMGYTALMYAVKSGNRSIVELLIKNGADVNIQNINNQLSALMIAALYRQNSMIELLINSGANTDLKDSFGNTVFDIQESLDNILSTK